MTDETRKNTGEGTEVPTERTDTGSRPTAEDMEPGVETAKGEISPPEEGKESGPEIPEVHRAPHFEGPLELPEDPFQAEKGAFPRGEIRGLLPGDLDPVPQHPDLHGSGRSSRDLQQDPDDVVHLHDVRGRLVGGFRGEVEQQDMPGVAGRPTLRPDLP